MPPGIASPVGDTQSRSDYGHQKARFARAGLFAHDVFPVQSVFPAQSFAHRSPKRTSMAYAHPCIACVNFLWKEWGAWNLDTARKRDYNGPSA